MNDDKDNQVNEYHCPPSNFIKRGEGRKEGRREGRRRSERGKEGDGVKEGRREKE